MPHIALLGALAAGLVLLVSGPAHAEFPFQAYETWKNPNGTPNLKIRSDRFFGSDFGGQEVTREVRDTPQPHLFLRLGQRGQTTDNAGSTFFAGNSLRFAHPETLTRIEAKFKIVQAIISTHCAANTTSTTEAAVQIFWTAFNDGSSSGPGDRTGDHDVNVRAVRRANSIDPPGWFRVSAGLCRCPNANCNITGPPFPMCNGTNDFATAVVGTKFALQIIHDPAGVGNAKFLAGFVGPGQTLGATFGYPSTTPPIPDHDQAVRPYAAIEANGAAADCTVASGGPKETDMQVQVLPKVRTNPEAVIP